MSKNTLNEIKKYGIGLALFFSTVAPGVLKAQTPKSKDFKVQKVLDMQAEYAAAKQALPQYVKDSTYIAKNRTVVNALPADIQKKYQANVYHYSNDPLKMAETFRNIRVDMDAYGNGQAQSTLLINNIDTYAKNTGRMLRTKISGYKNKYAEAVSGLTPQQKTELDNIQNNEFGGTGANSAAPADLKTSLKQELNKIEKSKIAISERVANLDTVSDRYINAQWLDRFPNEDVGQTASVIDLIRNNPNSSDKSGSIIYVLRDYIDKRSTETDKYSNTSPLSSINERKVIIGELAVEKAQLEYTAETWKIYGDMTAKAEEAARAGRKAEAEKLLKQRDEADASRSAGISEDVKEQVFSNAVKESFDYDLEIIRALQEQLKEEKNFVDTANYVLLAPPDVAEVMQKREESINMMQDKLNAESNPQFRGSLEKELKKQQNEYKSADAEIKSYVESNRKQWGENIQDLYFASVIVEDTYISARDQVFGNATADTKYSKDSSYSSSGAIAFNNNRETIQNGNRGVSNATMAQYNNVMNDFVDNTYGNAGRRNVIERNYKTKRSGSYSNKGLTHYGTYANAGAYVNVNKNSHTHNGTVGASSHSNRGASVNYRSHDGYGSVRGEVHYRVNTQGKGREGLKAFLFKW